ncbi:hypothetical protein P879_03073 [Paragonimus westermani]|uniref:Uncharacterized protein n=1 Tax=Paragonimus westermani TaxID=34504 RepID=A0A8T0DH31_9TREM|nr:hypothetical protein P879_03073 [Paragonimus westermani]
MIIHSEKLCPNFIVDIGLPCDEKTSFCRSKNAVCQPLNPIHFTESSQSTIWPKHAEEINEQVHHSKDISVCQCKENSISVYQKTLDYFECFPKLAHVAAECDACAQRNGDCYDLNGDGVGDGCKCPSDRSTMTNRKESAENVCAQVHVMESNLREAPMLLLVIYPQKAAVQYEALLEVSVNRSIHTPNRDIQIPLKCVASSVEQASSHDPRQVLEIIMGQNHLPLKRLSTGRKLVDLRVINEVNKEIYTAAEGARIRLDALLLDDTGFYKVISVEHCYYSNRSTSLSSKNPEELTMFVYKGVSKHLLEVNGSIPARLGFMERWAHIEVQTGPTLSSSPNSPTVPANTYVRSEFADLGFATLSSPLANSNSLRCHYALCLNIAHIIWISAVLLSLLTLVCLVFLGMYRRYRFLKEKTKPQMLHQSTVSPTSTCCHEILSKVNWTTLASNIYHQNPECLDKNSPPVCIVPLTDQYMLDTVNRSQMAQSVFASEPSDISYLQTNRLLKCSQAPLKTVRNCVGSLQDDNGYSSMNIAVNRKAISASENYCYCDNLKPVVNSKHTECHSVTPLQSTDANNNNGSIEQSQAPKSPETKYGARIHSAFTKNPEGAEYHSSGLHFCKHSPSDFRIEDTNTVIPETYFTRGNRSIFSGSNISKPNSVIVNCSHSDDLILLNNCGTVTNDSFATVKAVHR